MSISWSGDSRRIYTCAESLAASAPGRKTVARVHWIRVCARSEPSLRSRAVPGDLEHPDPLWIFGYGSLVWRPAFAFEESRPAYIRGYARRFWQASTDHRGVPERPGRVVTLIPDSGSDCWGTAYRVAPAVAEGVLANLDHRERGGFARHVLDTTLVAGERVETVAALVYWATPDNPNYLGPAPIETIVEQVRCSRGPSGSNVEYVVELARSLREMGAQDDHVFEIESKLSG